VPDGLPVFPTAVNRSEIRSSLTENGRFCGTRRRDPQPGIARCLEIDEIRGLETSFRNHRERRRPVVNGSQSGSLGRALPVGPNTNRRRWSTSGAASENRVACALVGVPARRFDAGFGDRPAYRGEEAQVGVDYVAVTRSIDANPPLTCRSGTATTGSNDCAVVSSSRPRCSSCRAAGDVHGLPCDG
jgi:hypothetical protein